MQPTNSSTSPSSPARSHEDEPALADGAPPPDPVRAEARPARSGLRALREILETVLLAVILFLAVRSFVLPYQVDGMSMTPNLQNNERVLVNRQAYHDFDLNHVLNWIPGVDRKGSWDFTPFGNLNRGDVVVLQPPIPHTQPFIKRVIGLPGDHVTIKDGYVYINGVQLDEQYIPQPISECPASPYPLQGHPPACDVTVPDDSVFVMGDNRKPGGSEDSRMFGTVKIDNIVGEAFFVNWPFKNIGPIGHGHYNE